MKMKELLCSRSLISITSFINHFQYLRHTKLCLDYWEYQFKGMERMKMKYKIILGAISLALTINSVQAGGIYRYHDPSIKHKSNAIQAKYKAQEYSLKLKSQKSLRKYLVKQLNNQIDDIDDLEDAGVAIINASRDLHKAEKSSLKHQKAVWDKGINMPMIEIADPYQNRTSIKRVNYRN